MMLRVNKVFDNDCRQPTIFLTGITGSLGSFLAAQALRSGDRVVALVRGDTVSDAQQRVRQALSLPGAEDLADSVQIVCGDLLHLDQICLDGKIQGDNLILIHGAAGTGFDESQAEINLQTNFGGTRQMLNLAQRMKLPLVYLSTAYVAGCRTGVAREDELDVGQTFHNSYEETKYQAEIEVRQWSQQTGLPTIILRPGIVLGDSQRGHLVKFNTLYNLLRVFASLDGKISDRQLRIVAAADATKNFIPVDYFAQVAWQLIGRGQPGTYHITHPSPITISELRDIFTQLFNVPEICFVEEKAFAEDPSSPAERLCRRAGELYLPYMRAEPTFDRHNTDEALQDYPVLLPDMDLAYYRRLLGYARAVNWGNGSGSVQKPDTTLPKYVTSYFTKFLAEKLQQRLLPDLRLLTTSFQIRFKEFAEMHWSLSIQEGILTSVSQNGYTSDCDYIVGVPAFTQIVSGKLSPQQAFFQQKVDIEGDIETGLKVAAVLSVFFKQYPYEVPGGHG